MKRFILLHYGYMEPSKEIMHTWNKWFESIKMHIVEMGSPFGQGMEITKTGIKELKQDMDAVTGYSIIQADNVEEAVKIAKSCPMIAGIRVYEAMPM